jgi:hypothetical protein
VKEEIRQHRTDDRALRRSSRPFDQGARDILVLRADRIAAERLRRSPQGEGPSAR